MIVFNVKRVIVKRMVINCFLCPQEVVQQITVLNCNKDIRKNCLTIRVIEHWNRSPREIVGSPSMEAVMCKLDLVGVV